MISHISVPYEALKSSMSNISSVKSEKESESLQRLTRLHFHKDLVVLEGAALPCFGTKLLTWIFFCQSGGGEGREGGFSV